MKPLSCTCRVCGNAMKLEIEESEWFTDTNLVSMATCDRCIDDHDKPTRERIAKYHMGQERECRKPYND